MRKGNQLILGFNSGIVKKIANPISNEVLQLFLDAGTNAVELSLQKVERMVGIPRLDVRLLEKFTYVSIHMPKMQYRNDEITKGIIDAVNQFIRKTHVDLLVFHPDWIEDWSILGKLEKPVAVENMDNRKKTGRSVEELKGVFNKNNIGFVLDVNHVLTNDPTMRLKRELLDAFGNRLVEIHASGISSEFIHLPISETMQDFLLKDLPKNVPIILESTMHKECNLKKLRQEIAYVKRCLLSD